MFRFHFPLFLLVFACAGCGSPAEGPVVPVLQMQESGTDALLIGLHAVSDRIVWAAGTGGSYAWTDDGGVTWHAGTVPGADSLQFRDVHAMSLDTAWLLSIGSGEDSRIYRTVDRGASWEMLFRNEIDEAFFDCFDFREDGSAFAFSDAVDGRFPLLHTEDGDVWRVLPPETLPSAQPGEGGFAASGTCLIVLDDQTVLIGTGNAATPRVLRNEHRDSTWTSSDVPLPGGEAAGVTTLAFRDAQHGVVLGGDITAPGTIQQNTAVTEDGGVSWRLASSPGFPGAVYGAAYVPGGILVAAGPGGAAFSRDDAQTWSPLDSLTWWSVDAAAPDAVWMVGPEGRIARISFRSAP
ncbi:MAG: hypothetical protein F4Y00_06875 [Bacteroidetes bacterium SB0662_bin_6]|nr:hypothetical protein [Bacteroidetes bacterium SB0668_bin_1]MYE04675.1 hypothetical protein [Bacteroidetes bacterium SB0662_bin_6]